MPQFTQIELDEILSLKIEKFFTKWIHRLRLKDWTISWKIARKDELGDHRSGRCDSILTKKVALIRILHPDDAASDWIDPFDLELTIVHELVHLHLDGWSHLFDEGDQAVIFLEQAVHTLSATLLSADRGNRHWTNFPEVCSVQDPSSVIR